MGEVPADAEGILRRFNGIWQKVSRSLKIVHQQRSLTLARPLAVLLLRLLLPFPLLLPSRRN